MLTQQAALEQVKAFVADVRAAGVPLKEAILFGSYARNEQGQWSDIDLALISDEFAGLPTDLHPIAQLLWQYGHLNLEPHTFPTSDFEDGDAFAEEIKRTGIVVG
jgi:uncharacterized protein